jgi:hypothetical protein
MAKPGRASQAKRGREKAKQEKRKDKLERRALRKQEKEVGPRPDGAEDPDLAGIVPGPQPPQE